MRKALILTMGLAVVLLWATSGAAHGRTFFGVSFGVPMHPGFVAPRVLVAPPGFVTIWPSGFVPRAGFVITPQIVMGPRALVTARPVSMNFAPQTVVVLPPVRRVPPVFVTAPRASFGSPAVIVLTPQTISGPRTAGGRRR